MTDTPGPSPRPALPPRAGERRQARRRFTPLWNLVFRGLRLAGVHVGNFYARVGIFLVAGAIVAAAATYGFAELAGDVRAGHTQAFDVAVLQWLHARQRPELTPAAIEITYLGTGTVVMMVVGVAALFLWHTEHKYSARLLLAATAGNILLNGVLKLAFNRPRPTQFDWQTVATSSSFPSGHAMSATVVYGTVAYLLARLQKHAWSRALTLTGAVALILVISFTRVYLGVHYPSDVLGGIAIGLAWAGFCMATLEATLALARRRAPAVAAEERVVPRELDALAAGGASPGRRARSP